MSDVQLVVNDGVAVVTLAAPQRRNALTLAMTQEIMSVCSDIDRDQSVGVAIVRGEGGHFCSGAHRDFLASLETDPAEATRFAQLGSVYESIHRLGNLLVPTIAAVRGAAVGAGVNLALAADLRIVAKDARFLAGFQRIGLHPGGGHFALAQRAIGHEGTVAFSFFGEEISGERAVQSGLAWEAVADDDVDHRALTLAKRAADDPELTRAMVRTFRLVTAGPTVSLLASSELEHAPQLWSMRRRHANQAPP